MYLSEGTMGSSFTWFDSLFSKNCYYLIPCRRLERPQGKYFLRMFHEAQSMMYVR